MAREVVSLATPSEGFELGPEKVGRVDGPNDQAAAQLHVAGRVQSIRIPTVRKAENFGVQRHDIQGQRAVSPSTQRRAFATVFFESQTAKPLGKHGVFGIGTNLRD